MENLAVLRASEFGDDGSQPMTRSSSLTATLKELMAVFEKFSARADEDTMIPRYMTGANTLWWRWPYVVWPVHVDLQRR